MLRVQAQSQLLERKSEIRTMKISQDGQAVFCLAPWQSEKIFLEGKIATGSYRTGQRKGEPRIPVRLMPNSMCILTEYAPDQPESERRITGLAMLPETFVGQQCEDGWLRLHPQYRLMLDVAHRPLFWQNTGKDPHKQHWGNTFQYMANKSGERILFALIANLPSGPKKQRARAFYEYYCKMNRIEPRIKEEQNGGAMITK